MPRIHLTRPDGSAAALDTANGVTLMQALTAAGEDGIVAECGGSAMCATCHVLIDPAWIDVLPPVADVEAAMLECTATEREPGSRLSCQITLGPELEGLRLRLPERQQ